MLLSALVNSTYKEHIMVSVRSEAAHCCHKKKMSMRDNFCVGNWYLV